MREKFTGIFERVAETHRKTPRSFDIHDERIIASDDAPKLREFFSLLWQPGAGVNSMRMKICVADSSIPRLFSAEFIAPKKTIVFSGDPEFLFSGSPKFTDIPIELPNVI